MPRRRGRQNRSAPITPMTAAAALVLCFLVFGQKSGNSFIQSIGWRIWTKTLDFILQLRNLGSDPIVWRVEATKAKLGRKIVHLADRGAIVGGKASEDDHPFFVQLCYRKQFETAAAVEVVLRFGHQLVLQIAFSKSVSIIAASAFGHWDRFFVVERHSATKGPGMALEWYGPRHGESLRPVAATNQRHRTRVLGIHLRTANRSIATAARAARRQPCSRAGGAAPLSPPQRLAHAAATAFGTAMRRGMWSHSAETTAAISANAASA